LIIFRRRKYYTEDNSTNKIVDTFTIINNTLIDIRYIGPSCKVYDSSDDPGYNSIPDCDQIDTYSNKSIIPVDVQNLLSSFRILSTIDDNNKEPTLNIPSLFSDNAVSNDECLDVSANTTKK
jgi:hypothetical protein